MLILTGPQGAGNHVWSKIFSLHPDVFGWKTLLANYWEPHRTAEPFAKCWRDPSLLNSFDWTQSDYYFSSISVPLGIGGSKWEPDVGLFIRTLISNNICPELVVCGRDQNILRQQQTRLRGEVTTTALLEAIQHTPVTPKFISYELLQLYRQQYLKTLSFNIPIAYNDSRISDFLSEDSNEKYVRYVDEYFLDECNKTGNVLKEKPFA